MTMTTSQRLALAWMAKNNIGQFQFERQWIAKEDIRGNPELADKFVAANPGFANRAGFRAAGMTG